MSNLSILVRLDAALAAYEEDTMSRADFVRFLTNSIEALEEVPYGVRRTLRRHEHDIEMEGYLEEEGFEANAVAAKAALKAWILDLKARYAGESR